MVKVPNSTTMYIIGISMSWLLSLLPSLKTGSHVSLCTVVELLGNLWKTSLRLINKNTLILQVRGSGLHSVYHTPLLFHQMCNWIAIDWFCCSFTLVATLLRCFSLTVLAMAVIPKVYMALCCLLIMFPNATWFAHLSRMTSWNFTPLWNSHKY